MKNSIKKHLKCLPITIWSNRLKVENWNMFWYISWRYAGVKAEERCIFATGNRFIHCQHDHLAYISSSLHSVTFHLTDGKKISCRARLGDFSGQLSDSSFLRCHQSFCINMEKVTSLKKNSFVVGQTEIPISRTYLKTARKKYKDYLAEQKVCS